MGSTSRMHGHRPKLEGAGRATERSARTPCGVLVIESDPDLQWRLARMLTVQGHRVVGTSSGEGALALMAHWPMDLILVDESLAGTDGVEVAQMLRERHPNVPVVLMATGERPEGAPAEVSGIAAIIPKPLQLDSLAKLIEAVRRSVPVAAAE